MCREINANVTNTNNEMSLRCEYWTYYKKTQMCLLLDGCSDNDDENAKSGKENCPPGKGIMHKLCGGRLGVLKSVRQEVKS